MRKRRKIIATALIVWCVAGCGGPYSSGDRVLVSKFNYDSGLKKPNRYDVVVFKFPERPVEGGVFRNYIKRLLGLPGEILSIFFGQIFLFSPSQPGALFKDHDDPQIPQDYLRKLAFAQFTIDELKDESNAYKREIDAFSHQKAKEIDEFLASNDMKNRLASKRDQLNALFTLPGEFRILRKPIPVMMAMRRIVYDNNYHAKDLASSKWRRWKPSEQSHWKTTETDHKEFTSNPSGDTVDWLRYRHIPVVRSNPMDARALVVGNGVDSQPKMQLISDFMGYNTANVADPRPLNWVSDLMLECDVEVQEAKGELRLELSRSIYRFQARFDLVSGDCTLVKLKPAFAKYAADGSVELGPMTIEKELAKKETALKGPGSYRLRFANIDARLTVWVDRSLPFGDGIEYDPPEIRNKGEEKVSDDELAIRRGPTANDLQPASIGSRKADVKVSEIKLWRDTYYTLSPGSPPGFIHAIDAQDDGIPSLTPSDWTKPSKWRPLRELHYKAMYVQPGHYLCLGDNSPSSADSRSWGLVPERLMLGRALMVYYPFNRFGPIH